MTVLSAPIVYVTNTAYMGDGGLYRAIYDVDNNGTIIIDASLSGKTITPSTSFLTAKTFSLIGNGITLQMSCPLQIGSTGNITITGVHFTGGGTFNASEGAIRNSGKLTLKSCIFSNNTASMGGAIYNSDGGDLTIIGCTFWNNHADQVGGAIYNWREYNWNKASVVLIGNVFYGNTANHRGNVLFNDGGTYSTQYNVSDNTSDAGGVVNFTGTGDINTTDFLLSAKFKLMPHSDAIGIIGILPTGYPTTDFYGKAISLPASAGAIQEIENCNTTAGTLASGMLVSGGILRKYTGTSSHVDIPFGIKQIGKDLSYEARSNGSFSIYDDDFDNDYAFFNRSNLASVDFPCSLEKIGDFAFASNSLTTIDFPSQLTHIGDYAFTNSSITALTIPNSVNYLGKAAFKNCIEMQTLNLSNSLTSIEGSTFDHCTSLSSIVIPNSVEKIGPDAFAFCTSLESIILPNNLKTIELEAFYNCSSLSSVNIPSSVTSIGGSAFANCSNLQTVVVNWQTPLSVNANVFNGIKSNCKLIVPYGTKAKYMAANVWRNFIIEEMELKKLSTPFMIDFETEGWEYELENGNQINKWVVGSAAKASGSKSLYVSNDNINNAYEIDKSSVVHFYVNVYFEPSEVDYQLSFDWKGIGELDTQYAYDYMRLQLEDLSVVPESGTRLTSPPLGLYCGAETWRRSSFIIPSSYSGTTKRLIFSWINNGNGLGSQPPIAIDNIQIKIRPTAHVHLDDQGTLYNTDNIKDIEELTITGNIDARDFQFMRDNMPKLMKLDLAGATVVAYEGDKGTRYGTWLGYPSNEIPFDAFYFADTQTGKTSLKTVIMPLNIAAIADNAFRSCSELTGTLDIPVDVISIGNYAFYHCTGLSGNLILPNGIIYIGINTFYNCIGLSGNLHLPLNLSEIGNGAFYYCTGINGRISIPSQVREIGEWTFSQTNIAELILPEGLLSIKNGAFSRCNKLTSISLPSTLTHIGDYAFQCELLGLIQNNSSIPINITEDVFKDVNKNICELQVPSDALNDYKQAFVWKDFFNINSLTAIKTIEINSPIISPIVVENGFSVTNLDTPVILYLYSITGQMFLEKQVSNNEFVSIDHLPKGIYIVEIEKEGKKTTQKIIKK